MKKLMIAIAMGAIAISTQAASMKWSTGTGIKAPASATDGTFGSTAAASGTLSLYVWIVSESVYNSATLSSMTSYDAVKAIAGGKESNASATGKNGSFGASAQWEYGTSDWASGADTTIYGLVLTTYKSGDIDMYIANKATGSINGSGTVTVAPNNLAKYIGGDTTGTAITGWTSSSTSPVPEPTSGLLLLLGFAGLALRRKRT